MSAITTRLELDVYDDFDDPTVKTWRDTINKNAVSSAFSKIDAYAISTDSRIDDLELARTLFRIYGSFSTENNYVATSSDIGTLANGIQIQLSVDISNTNSAVLNINSGGNKTLQKLSPLGVATNLTVGDLIANKIYTFEYQNGVWIMMGGVTSNQVVVSDSTAGNLLMVSNDKTIDESGVSLYNGKIASEGINIGSMLGVDGSHNLILPTMSLTPGTYIGVTIDAYGRVSGITTPNPLATGNFVFRASDGILSWASYAPDSEKLGGNLPSYYLPATSKAVDSDLLDGLDSLAFATSTHNHDSTYLGVAAQAVDSDKLNGQSASYYLAATGKAADSDKLDNLDSTYFMPVSYQNGWIPVTGTFSWKTASTINVSSGAAAVYSVGDRLKWITNTGSTQRYGTVVSIADTVLTVAVNTDHVLANETWTQPFYSHQTSPVGFPQWFNYTPTLSVSGGTAPTYTRCFINRYCQVGKLVTVTGQWGNVEGGTAGAGAEPILITLPVPPKNNDDVHAGSAGYNNGSTWSMGGIYLVASASKFVITELDWDFLTGAEQNNVDRSVSFTFTYEAA
jgi:hypothetical protein